MIPLQDYRDASGYETYDPRWHDICVDVELLSDNGRRREIKYYMTLPYKGVLYSNVRTVAYDYDSYFLDEMKKAVWEEMVYEIERAFREGGMRAKSNSN